MAYNYSNDELIKITVEMDRVRRYKNDWCICDAYVKSCKQGDLRERDCITLKGVMPSSVAVGNFYNIMCVEENDPKWGQQYKVLSVFSAITFDENDDVGKKKFLTSIFTAYQIDCMYAVLDDPYKILEEKNAAALIQVKGCGLKTAERWFRRFESNVSKAKVYVELEEYNLTNGVIDKLMDRYNSPDMVIDKVKKNPYILCTEVKGIGWKTADDIALSGGLLPNCQERISAYIFHYLDKQGEDGCSWITADELLGAIIEELGEEIEDAEVGACLRTMIDKGLIWHSEDKTKLGLIRYFNIENKVATELIRIRDAESGIQIPSDWKDRIKHLEHRQGWSFTTEQIEGILLTLNNNIAVVTGPAGSGKSTIVTAMIEVLKQYSYVQCSLSGRAAARMSEITGEEGYTIHRLLGFPKGEPEHGKFVFHEEEKMPYDIYIVDEISMIDSYLFYDLIRAIPDGAKLIMLGDPNQLESIGSGNIAHDMIQSDEISTVSLTKIHRQAAKSAIITESIKIRNGTQILEKEQFGEETRGELQDLTITSYNDSSNTYFEVMKKYLKYMNEPDFDIMECQIIVPIKSRGEACTTTLNNAIQELYNPEDKKKKEFVGFSNGKNFILREGDKVMCVSNNYFTNPPIYNGSTGVLKCFQYDEDSDKEYMIIDFLCIGEVKIESKYWSGIELAYASTVHKQQGNQSNIVIFALDFSAYALLTREMIYTGITRAKKKCELICQTGALRYAISKEGVSKKQTHLQQCLYDIAHPKIVF